jgi:hypothetical protein
VRRRVERVVNGRGEPALTAAFAKHVTRTK